MLSGYSVAETNLQSARFRLSHLLFVVSIYWIKQQSQSHRCALGCSCDVWERCVRTEVNAQRRGGGGSCFCALHGSRRRRHGLIEAVPPHRPPGTLLWNGRYLFSSLIHRAFSSAEATSARITSLQKDLPLYSTHSAGESDLEKLILEWETDCLAQGLHFIFKCDIILFLFQLMGNTGQN